MERRHEATRRDLAARQDTSGDNYVAAIDGQDIRDRGIAGELLHRHAERIRGSRAERQVGTIAGFNLLVSDNLLRGPEIVLKGAEAYTAKVTDTALGTIRSVEYTIQHLDETAANLAQNIIDTRKRLADTQAQVGAPFEYAERLATLARRQQEIEDQLDLTKGQAPSGLDGKQDEAPAGSGMPTAPEPDNPQMLHDGAPATDPDVASTWFPFDNLAFDPYLCLSRHSHGDLNGPAAPGAQFSSHRGSAPPSLFSRLPSLPFSF
jgi:hypothetical protein